MNRRAVWALVRRDLTVVRRSRALMIPLVLVPVVLLVLLPVGLGIGPALAAGSPAGQAELARMIAQLPPALRDLYAGLSPAQLWVMLVHTQLLPPLFLVVPFMVANVIAADSFAGERERKTLEALLHSPLTDAELLLGKVLAAWLPALATALLGFIVYAVAANASAWPIMGRLFVPTVTWLVLVLWVAPAFALLGLAAAVLVSLRVSSTQEAMQLSGLLILPLIAVIIGQVRGVVMLGPTLALLAGALLWLLSLLLLRYGARSFRRSRLVAQL